MMIGNGILQTSKVIFLFRSAYRKYRLCVERYDEAYKNSKLYTRVKSVFAGITIIFQYSLLGRITEMKQEGGQKEPLESSKFVKWVSGVSGALKTSLIGRAFFKLVS